MNPVPNKGVIAAGHPLTAQTGADVLRDGGTAIDAAIAALAMACVTEPILCSPGGGGFAMVRSVDGPVSVIDFFPNTPIGRRPDGRDDVRAVVADFGTATQAFHIGPGTTASPGFFAGIDSLHRRGATRPLVDLFDPAIRSAREGVAISAFQHHLATVVRPILTATPSTAALFAPSGDVMSVGETFRNPGLADALSILATDGFATSDVGMALLELQAEGGHLTSSDLTGYQPFERPPLRVRVGESTVFLNPPPAAGGTLVEHSLERIDRTASAVIASAFRETDHARRRRRAGDIDVDPALLRQRGTTHISVIDGNGGACSVTTSNGSGNGEVAGRFGFMPNNILGEDDVNPAGTSAWALDTRLSSGMCPTLIEGDDGTLTVLGSGGSNRIRTAIAQVVVHLCLDDVELAAAIDAPRLHVENGHLDFEDIVDAGTRAHLTNQFPDHRAWPERNLFYGGVHAARADGDGRFSGAGDSRRDGVAIVVD